MTHRKRLHDFHKFVTIVSLTAAALYCIWILPKLDKRQLLAEQLKPDENKIKEMIGSDEHLAKNSSHTFESCFKNVQEKETPVRRFFIRPKDCDPNQTLIIMVKSSLVRGENRRFIRSTWGRRQNVSVGTFQFTTRTIFIVGQSKKRDFKDRTIRYESELYDDILQVDLIDGYSMKNLVDKSLSLLRFGARNCPGAKFFLIADDDTMLAPWLLPKVLPLDRRREDDQHVYAGFQFSMYVVPRTTKQSRFVLSEKNFPCVSLPPYVQAISMILSHSNPIFRRTVKSLLNESQAYYSEKLIDDVYINWLSRRTGVPATYFPPDMLDMRCLNIEDRRSSIKNVFRDHEISSAENILTLHDCDTLEQMRRAWHRLCDASTSDDDSVANLHQAYCSIL